MIALNYYAKDFCLRLFQIPNSYNQRDVYINFTGSTMNYS